MFGWLFGSDKKDQEREQSLQRAHIESVNRIERLGVNILLLDNHLLQFENGEDNLENYLELMDLMGSDMRALGLTEVIINLDYDLTFSD